MSAQTLPAWIQYEDGLMLVVPEGSDFAVAEIATDNRGDVPVYFLYRVHPQYTEDGEVYTAGECLYSGTDWEQCLNHAETAIEYVSHTDPSQGWTLDSDDDFDCWDDSDSDLWVNDPALGTVLRHEPVDLGFLPGTVCRWDAQNSIYWVCSEHRAVAVITVGNSEDFPTYSMFRVYPETVGNSTVYRYGWCVYSGQDWVTAQRWALELI